VSDREVLIAARKLIEDPGAWTTGEYARTATGRRCAPWSMRAVCYCAEGACIRAARYSGVFAEQHFIGSLRAEIDEEVADFNDSADHASVLRMFDRAIEAAT
jgi:hypothetical protein